MRLVLIIVSLALAWAQSKTTQDRVYSDAQARRGQVIYDKVCASCHAPNLEGDGQAPALAGKDFDADWKDQPLSDLFERIRLTMPGDAPGTLKAEDVADVMAYLFSRAKFPAGVSELPADPAALQAITYMPAAR
jgi:mono/diheme cytochrome c family protein